jgi:hypothetical protein
MKLYFLRPEDSGLVATDCTLINRVKARFLERSGFSEAANLESADAIIFREKSYFKEWRFIDHLLADPIARKYAPKLYTINSDPSSAGLLRGVYTAVPKHRYNPRIHQIVHYERFLNDVVLKHRHEPRPEPRYLATWRGNKMSHRKLREGLERTCSASPSFLFETTDSWQNHSHKEQQRYVDVVRTGRFSLCPAGWAAVSFRIYESMVLGVCPVIIADDFVPPEGPDWNSFALRIPENALDRLELTLSKFADSYAEMGRRARDAWERFFSPEKIIDHYCDSLLACMRANPEPGPMTKEIERWRSLHTYWSNGWTIPQRVKIKLRNLVNS